MYKVYSLVTFMLGFLWKAGACDYGEGVCKVYGLSVCTVYRLLVNLIVVNRQNEDQFGVWQERLLPSSS